MNPQTVPSHDRITLSPDFGCYTDYSAVDETYKQLVALHLFDYEQNVKANWATIATSGAVVNYLNGCQFETKGMKAHKTFKTILPDSGWLDMWLIHKQAITETANPFREPYFYVFVPDASGTRRHRKATSPAIRQHP